jgi:UBX domain-containing protein 1
VCKITLYENGFTIDDGEFQDYSDPKNKEFMKKLNEGLIPSELRKKYPKGELSISLSDKTGEKFVPPPPPAYIEFSGEGVSLSEPSKDPKFAKKSKPCQNFILEPNRNR